MNSLEFDQELNDMPFLAKILCSGHTRLERALLAGLTSKDRRWKLCVQEAKRLSTSGEGAVRGYEATIY